MAKKRNGKPRRNAWRRRSKPGDAPGQINVDPSANPTNIRVIGFGDGAVFEREIKEVGEIRTLMAQAPKIWIDVIGLGSEQTLRALGELL
ncbi:MAG: hypothetical protein ACK57P_06990 [Planctomycetota bacterium]